MAEYKSNYTGEQIDAGIGKANSAVQPADLGNLASKDTVNYETDVTNKPTIPSEVTETTVANWGFTKNTGDYTKPSGGIPSTDMAESVQTSLGKADTAIQDISGKQDKIDSSHKLSADLISDGETNKTVTATEKTTWDGKSVVSGTNDGTNWSTITIDGTTKNIPSSGSGTATDVQINGTSIVSSGTANILTETAYNASSNKIATVSDLPDITTKQDTLVSGTNIKTINNESILGSGNININNYDEAVIEEQVYDGYNSSNDSSSLNTTAPYVLKGDNYMPSRIYSVKLKIKEAGILSFGKIKKSDVVLDTTADVSKVTYIETVTLSNTGEQTVVFTNTINLNSDEYFVIATSTDTAKFAYGSNGNDKGFYFKNAGTSKWSQSNNSIGISLTSRTLQLTNASIYKGKNISILGDSISTYSGYIPSGNVTYYPAGTVQSVDDTWWKKLIDALDMNLLVNNSWSGSRVTTTDGETSAGCMTRCQALDSGGVNPDVIIVWMGINDFNNEVALGTYDGSTSVPSTTTTFREAYGIMLDKILTKYQESEVWVCTLPQCERNTPTGFPEINGNSVALVEFNKAIEELARAFGVKILDHNKCGLTYQNMPTYNPDNLHPNNFGHSLIANNDIRQMDNAIRKRY